MNAVSSLFDAAKRRYETACAEFNDSLSFPPVGGYFEQLAMEGRYLERATDAQAALFATPARTLEDAAFKLQLSMDEVLDEGFPDWRPAQEAITAAMAALQARDIPDAIRLIDVACSIEAPKRYPELLEPALDGARAARKDLERMNGEA